MYKMNKRIRELMAEADRKCSETRGVYDEILAELIVKETLQVARAGIEFGDGMEDAVYTYFGVEND